jgi:hypothetical protein
MSVAASGENPGSDARGGAEPRGECRGCGGADP